jgi:hypothetical protein
MTLDIATKGMLSTEEKLRSQEGMLNPVFISLQMMALSQFTGAVEEHLAEYEKDLEINYAIQLKKYLLEAKMKVTESERMVDIDLAETKGQVKYLSRLVNSAWKQVGVAQSRINHLNKEAGTNI